MAMTDLMVDLETTDTNPHLGGILQIAAVKFNYDTGEVGPIFDRCPALLPFRRWSEGTRDFWKKHPRVYGEIIARQENAEPVFRDFMEFASDVGDEGTGLRFWCKPQSFDWPFVASHMEQLGLPMPMHYHSARDIASFVAGMAGDPRYPDLNITDFEGDPHNALHDAAHQIDVLFTAKKRFISTEVL